MEQGDNVDFRHFFIFELYTETKAYNQGMENWDWIYFCFMTEIQFVILLSPKYFFVYFYAHTMKYIVYTYLAKLIMGKQTADNNFTVLHASLF